MAPPQRVLGLNHRNIVENIQKSSSSEPLASDLVCSIAWWSFICNVGQDHSLTLNQCFKQSGLFK